MWLAVLTVSSSQWGPVPRISVYMLPRFSLGHGTICLAFFHLPLKNRLD
jgi:hypothetical protein